MPDRMEREVEEILRKLDKFVPEESPVIRTRRKVGHAASDSLHAVAARLSRISLGQVMLASLVLVVLAYFFRYANPALARWAIIAGLILFFTAFVLSLMGGRSRYEKRWRGEVMNLSEPSLSTRLRNWFQRRGRGR